MDWTLFAIVVGAGAVILVIALVMLNRAWGDFPGRAGPPGLGPPPAPPSSQPARLPVPAETDEEDEEDEEELWPAGAPQEGLIPITEPALRRAVVSALDRGGTPYATYFIRYGERVYLVPGRIADPGQRAQVVRIFEGLRTGDMSGISIVEAIKLINQLGK